MTSAHELDPDLVLMDVNLPGINGLEATRQILADHAGGKPVVVLVLSTYEAAEYGPQAEEVGAAGFIPKSEFSPERLVEAWSAATRRLVDGKRPRAALSPSPARSAAAPSPPSASSRSAMLVRPEPLAVVADVEAAAVVADAEVRASPSRSREPHRGARRLRVLLHVLQRLEHREVHRRLDVLRVAAEAVGVHGHRDRRLARLRLQRRRSPLSASSGG